MSVTQKLIIAAKKPCAYCRLEFVPKHRNQKYHSLLCQSRARYARNRERILVNKKEKYDPEKWKRYYAKKKQEREAKRIPKKCAYESCNNVIERSSDLRQLYCSKRCGRRAQRAANPERYRDLERKRYRKRKNILGGRGPAEALDRSVR